MFDETIVCVYIYIYIYIYMCHTICAFLKNDFTIQNKRKAETPTRGRAERVEGRKRECDNV